MADRGRQTPFKWRNNEPEFLRSEPAFKCFALYTKLPENLYDFIKIAEKNNERGNKMYEELMMLYKSDYAPKAESDVGGGTRIVVDLNKVYPGNVVDRLRNIKNLNT